MTSNAANSTFPTVSSHSSSTDSPIISTSSSVAAAAASPTEIAAATIAERQPVVWRLGLSSIVGKNLRHLMTTWNLIFTLGIPAVMYLMFGTNLDYADIPLKHGNVSAGIMISLAQYGAAVFAASTATSIAIDSAQGWPRALALTPFGVRGYACSKLLVTLVMSALTIAVIYVLGMCTSARMTGPAWVLSFLIVAVSIIVPALVGLIIALIVRSEEAYGLSGGIMALLGFVSGMFVPLGQLGHFFQTLARFTPLWGINVIATSPLRGWSSEATGAIINITIWLAVFIAASVFLSLRALGR